MTVKAKFQCYEIVRVLPKLAELSEIHGATGAILGLSEFAETEYDYAVFIESDQFVWAIPESSLESTGVIKQRKDFYDDNVRIRVQVDADGTGTIKEVL